MKVCPHCGKIVSYNSYFGAYICDNCNWEDCPRTKRQSIVIRSCSKGLSASRSSAMPAKAKSFKAVVCK